VQNINKIYDMHEFLRRDIEPFVVENLNIFPAVEILGPRQCGKSTLVKMISAKIEDFIYIDLQNMDDRNKLREPRLFFQANSHRTICMDEIQLMPELFSILRSEIDSNRRPGRFILLGSASRELIQKLLKPLPAELDLSS
jgi:predicted AAA+ superfamily ATPase